MRIVIIDDNEARRDQITNVMPDYAACVAVPYGDSALSFIKPDLNGEVPDIVILDGDDKKGMGLYTFDWMKTKSKNNAIASIPVIILTEDEFSDRSLDFLDIDDAVFYEGDIDEDKLFSCVMDTISSVEFAEEPIPLSYTGEKSYDKVAGLSVKVAGETIENKRSIVLDIDNKLANLEAALERGRRKTETIKALMENALDVKRQASINNVNSGGFLNKVRVSKGLEPVEPNFVKKDAGAASNDELEYSEKLADYDNNYDEEDIPEEFRMKNLLRDDSVSAKIDAIGDKLKSQPFQAVAAHGGNWLNARMKAETGGGANRPIGNDLTNTNQNVNRPTILVVDDDEKDRQLCEISLSSRFNVVTLESGMKAIDYFVKNTADLVLIDTYMPNLGGVQTLYSIRYQANGRYVPVIYMVDKRYPVSVQSLSGENVMGVIQKPISASRLVGAIDGVLRSRGQ